MANLKISELTALTAIVSGDLIVVVDVSDTTDASSGTTKKITRSDFIVGLASSGANSDITSLTGLTTALSVAQGGTGASTLLQSGLLIGNGTSAISAISLGTANQVLGMNSGATANEYKTMTAGTGMTITHAANSITLASLQTGLIVADYFSSSGRYSQTVVSSGSATFGTSGLDFTTGGTGTSSIKEIFTWTGSLSSSSLFSTNAQVATAPTTGSCFFGVGAVVVDGSGHTYTGEHYGFKITYASSTATLSATNADNTTETATDITSGITVTNYNDYYAFLTAGTNVKYYISGTLKATHSTNLPTGSFQNDIQFSISNNSTATTFRMIINGFNWQKRGVLL